MRALDYTPSRGKTYQDKYVASILTFETAYIPNTERMLHPPKNGLDLGVQLQGTIKSDMRFWRLCANLTIVARVRPAVGGIAQVLLLGWALTACLYSQSLPFTSQPPVPAAQQGFESQTRQNGTCGLRLFNPGYAPFPKAQAPLVFRGLWPSSSSRPARGGSSSCHPFAITGLMGNPVLLGNEDSRASALRRAELRGVSLGAWDQSQSAPASARSSAGNGSPGHIFWVIPAYKVDYLKNVKPLTPREKFTEWARGAYDPLGLAASATEAALEHSPRDGYCGYGNGWGGYGKCYGSALLDSNISSFFGDFLFPVLMHQDPRYFALRQGSAGKRILYAVSRVFITRTDSGGTAVDYSALSGTILAAAASNLYYPRQDRGVGLSLSHAGWDLGYTALFNVAAEFWPEIKRAVDRTF